MSKPTVPELLAQGWKNDGHLLTVTAEGPDPHDVRIVIECPTPCAGPYIACGECMGQGTAYDDDDEEVPCSACDETGMDDGTYSCWFKYAPDLVWDSYCDSEDNPYRPGHFQFLYRSHGWGEDAFVEVRRGCEEARRV